jgi:hypothetical protein
MCRTKELGGRRCPAHTDPEKVAAYNAVRRQRYASRKTVFANYGFTDPNKVEREPGMTSLAQRKASVKVLAGLTQAQRNSIGLFTSNNYEWINGSLFGLQNFLYEPNTENYYYSYRPKDIDLEGMEYKSTNDTIPMPTVDNVVTIVDTLDDAFQHTEPEEKILYRGKGQFSARFNENVSKYVDDNYGIGQEIVFDGYQSASMHPGVGSDYAGEGGIVYELKTVSGLNAHSISHFEDEQEILLPRQTRWKVVGVHKDVIYAPTVGSTGGFQEEAPTVTVVQMVEIDDDGNELKEHRKTAPLNRKRLQKSVKPEPEKEMVI